MSRVLDQGFAAYSPGRLCPHSSWAVRSYIHVLKFSCFCFWRQSKTTGGQNGTEATRGGGYGRGFLKLYIFYSCLFGGRLSIQPLLPHSELDICIIELLFICIHWNERWFKCMPNSPLFLYSVTWETPGIVKVWIHIFNVRNLSLPNIWRRIPFIE